MAPTLGRLSDGGTSAHARTTLYEESEATSGVIKGIAREEMAVGWRRLATLGVETSFRKVNATQ